MRWTGRERGAIVAGVGLGAYIGILLMANGYDWLGDDWRGIVVTGLVIVVGIKMMASD